MKIALILSLAGLAFVSVAAHAQCDPFVSISDVKVVGNSSTGKNDLVATIKSLKAGAMSLNVIWKNFPAGSTPASGSKSIRVSTGATTLVIAQVSPTIRVNSIARFMDFTTSYAQSYITLNHCK